nr:MAG TPA_asm: hypothetical protein [Caudoviricetes sp.]
MGQVVTASGHPVAAHRFQSGLLNLFRVHVYHHLSG